MRTQSHQIYNAHSDVSRFNTLVARLEQVEAIRAKTLTQARKNIAPKLGITPSSLENYRTLRLKGVPHWLMEKAKAILVATLQSEMEALGHEIEIHRQTHGGHRSDALVEAETHMAKVRALLAGKAAVRVATHTHPKDPPK